jgi:serine/threonine-protein kinase
VDQAETHELASGFVLHGTYRVVRKIGEGGMGIVYEAEHTRLGQRVAVKVVNATFSTPADIGRFEREAKASARVKNAFAVNVFDIDVSPEGMLYMVMEYLEGRTLKEATRDQLPELSHLCDWLCNVCDALAAAHALGIVHRDIKPENVFLVDAEPVPYAKVLDFGISKILDESPANMTVNSKVLGTPRYMSPEQMRQMPVTQQSDVFSLGVMAYQMLSGEFPYSNLMEVLGGRAVPLESRRPDLPTEIVHTVMRALAVEPPARPTAVEFGNALAPFALVRPSARSVPLSVHSAPFSARAAPLSNGPTSRAPASRAPSSRAPLSQGPGSVPARVSARASVPQAPVSYATVAFEETMRSAQPSSSDASRDPLADAAETPPSAPPRTHSPHSGSWVRTLVIATVVGLLASIAAFLVARARR